MKYLGDQRDEWNRGTGSGANTEESCGEMTERKIATPKALGGAMENEVNILSWFTPSISLYRPLLWFYFPKRNV